MLRIQVCHAPTHYKSQRSRSKMRIQTSACCCLHSLSIQSTNNVDGNGGLTGEEEMPSQSIGARGTLGAPMKWGWHLFFPSEPYAAILLLLQWPVPLGLPQGVILSRFRGTVIGVTRGVEWQLEGERGVELLGSREMPISEDCHWGT